MKVRYAPTEGGYRIGSSLLHQLGEEPAERIEEPEKALHRFGGRLWPCKQVEEAETNDEDNQNRLDPFIHGRTSFQVG